MGKRYHHLTLIEREQIGMLKAQGLSLRQTAKSLGRSHSTLVRELKKNDLIVYLPFRGYISAVCRRQFAKKGRSLKSAEVRTYVHEKISLGWSPEQISGRIGKDLPGLSISHEAIYKYIYRKARELIPQLARRHRWRYRKNRNPRCRRMTIPNRVPISERPGEIEARTEFGHWESDSIVSRASREALNVLVERKSRFTQITKLQQMTSSSTRDVITQRLLRFSVLVSRGGALHRLILGYITIDAIVAVNGLHTHVILQGLADTEQPQPVALQGRNVEIRYAKKLAAMC